MFATYDETEFTEAVQDVRANAEAIRAGLVRNSDTAAAIWGSFLCAVKPNASSSSKAWFLAQYANWKARADA